MQIHQLVVFKKVADTKSFSRAGTDLYLSQSTVSTHIGNLEEFFGRKLFDRLGKQTVLTPFGERFYTWAEQLLNMHSQAIDDLKDYTGELSGVLHIAASTVPAQYMVPRMISFFRQRFRAVTFVVQQGNSEDIADLLLRGRADLGIVGEKYYPEKIEHAPFCQEKLVLITPRSLDLCGPVSVEDLTSHPFIFRSRTSGTQAAVEKQLRQACLDASKLNVIAYLDSVQAIKQAVKDGLGLSFISELAARDYLEQGLFNVYPVQEFSQSRPFYFAYNRGKTLPPYAREFISMGKELYEGLRH